MIDRLKHMKETLASCVESQLGNLHNVDAKELGEVVDMVKDLEEAIYYCTITKSMEEAEKREKHSTEHHYYTPVYYRDMDRDNGRRYYYMPDGTMYPPDEMYYPNQPRDSQGRFTGRRGYSNGESSGGNGSSGSNGNSRSYTEMNMPFDLRDGREGRSPMSRRMYMESK